MSGLSLEFRKLFNMRSRTHNHQNYGKHGLPPTMVPDQYDSAIPHTSVVGPGSETSEPSIFLKRKEPLSPVISLPVFVCLLPSVWSMSLSALGVPPHCCFELSGNWNSGSCTKESWRCQLAANMPKALINWQQGRLTLQWIEMQQGRQVWVKAGNWQIGCWEKCVPYSWLPSSSCAEPHVQLSHVKGHPWFDTYSVAPSLPQYNFWLLQMDGLRESTWPLRDPHPQVQAPLQLRTD